MYCILQLLFLLYFYVICNMPYLNFMFIYFFFGGIIFFCFKEYLVVFVLPPLLSSKPLMFNHCQQPDVWRRVYSQYQWRLTDQGSTYWRREWLWKFLKLRQWSLPQRWTLFSWTVSLQPAVLFHTILSTAELLSNVESVLSSPIIALSTTFM